MREKTFTSNSERSVILSAGQAVTDKKWRRRNEETKFANLKYSVPIPSILHSRVCGIYHRTEVTEVAKNVSSSYKSARTRALSTSDREISHAEDRHAEAGRVASRRKTRCHRRLSVRIEGQ